MFKINNNYENIKVGMIVAFDIHDSLGVHGKNTLVEVLEIEKREPYEDFDYDTGTFYYIKPTPLATYRNINTGEIHKCDIV